MYKVSKLSYLIIVFFVFTVSCFSKSKVIRVIDGDTFVLETGERVRLIGINSPELKDLYGLECKQYLADIIEGKEIDLFPDSISKETDIHGRLLKYIYLNGEDINYKMIVDGYAFAYLKYNFQKKEIYKEGQIIAKNNDSGLWKKQSNISTIDSLSDKVKNDSIISKHNVAPRNFKIYIVGSLIFILLLFLIYYYFKK